MSDGDNVQWLTNDFARSPRWFGSNYRGDFDFTFDMSPSLADVNPTALKYFYDQAAGDSNKTFFVAAGGQGLNYPSATPDIEGFMDATVPAMQAVDQNIISVLDDAGFNLSKLQQMVGRPEIMGMMLKAGPAYAGHNGTIYWHEGKPIVSVKYTLWDGFDTPDEIVSSLNALPRNPLNNQDSYTIVNVHPWSTSTSGGGQGDPMSNVKHIVDQLSNGVEVVTLEELMIHLRNNHGTLVSNPVGQNIVLNGDFEVPAPGNASRPAEWFYAAAAGATQLVSGADSDGDGTKAAAINQSNAVPKNESGCAGIRERTQRRRDLFLEIGKHLPPDLYYELGQNQDVLDPEEAFAERPEASEHLTIADAETAPRLRGQMVARQATALQMTSSRTLARRRMA